MFTVIFAVARTVGWISQWKEMNEIDPNKISRPRQLYVGKKQREFKKIEDREKTVKKDMYPNKVFGKGKMVQFD